MDSGVVPSKVVHDHNNEHHQETQGVMENQHHHHDHHEKKSVMKKVKEKARKIKDTIKHKHGLNTHDDHHDLTDEDDDNKPSEIHGAPIYDSATYNESGIHQEPRIVVVTPTTNSTESDHVKISSSSDGAARTFVDQKDDEKSSLLGQGMVNLERKVELEEDPHAPTSRLDAYTPSNYETKVTDTTGQGRREIDITPVEDSLARMTVVNELGKAKSEARVSLPTHETPYTSVKSHGLFSSENQNVGSTTILNNEYSENLKAEPKVVSSSSDDTHIHNYPPVHGLVSPDLSSSSNKTEYPDDPIHTISNEFPRSQHATDMFASSNKTEYPHDPIHTYSNEFPKSQHSPDMSASSNKTEYPHDPIHTYSNEFPKSQHPDPDMSACSNKTEYPHEPIHSYSNEFPKSQHPPNMSASSETQHNPYVEKDDDDDDFAFKPISPIPSETPILPNMSNSALIGAGSHDQFLPEEEINPQVATSSISGKNAIASSDLGYYGNKEEDRVEEKQANQSSYTEKISNATSAVADKAVSAKNVVASKLGYGDNTEAEYKSGDNNTSNQTSYTDKISSATSAIADKAVSTKNAVASKLGYGDTEESGTRNEEYKSGDNNSSNQTSYTDKISNATSAIADRAISAKNVVASKLGYGEKDDVDSEVYETREASELNAENAQKIALSLSEELAPVYRNYETKNDGVMEQDKGVSVKDYLSERLRPGEEDMALKDVISDTLQNKPNEETLRSSLDDAVMRKQEEDQQHLEKVTTRTEFNKESESPGKGVVGKLKDYVVGSWFGKPGDNTQSTTPVAGSEGLSKNNVVGEAGCVVEDRRSSESSTT